jgi:hypothetical protein
MSAHDTDGQAVRLLGPLDRELGPMSTVDIGRAMAVGARQRLVQRVAAVAGTAVATVLAVLVAYSPFGPQQMAAGRVPPEPTACTAVRLPVVGDARTSRITGGDPTGRYLFGEYGVDRRAIVWHDGQPVDLWLAGYPTRLTDINATGSAVGTAREDGAQFPFVAEFDRTGLKGTFRLDSQGIAYAINSAGTIVGTDQSEFGASESRPKIWRTAINHPGTLPLPPGATAGAAQDIDDSGTVVGWVRLAEYSYLPYIWFADGTHAALPVPSAWGQPAAGMTLAIDGVFAIGRLDGNATAVRWNLRTGDVREYDDLHALHASNRYGWVVGVDDNKQAVFVGTRSRLVLPPPTDLPGTISYTAQILSIDGRTIGGTADDGNGAWAIVWRCS